MACKTLLATGIAAKFSDEVRASATGLTPTPVLVGFLANTDPAAATYAEWTAKACADVGIAFELRTVERTDLEDAIMAANRDPAVHGIMVYYPVFGPAQDQYLQNIVSPAKDVEGLCHTYRYNMYHNVRFLDAPADRKKCIIPCTPLAVVKVLEHLHIYNPMLPYGGRLYGKTIAVVNRSEVVGRPLAALLANDGARVLSVDIGDVLEFHRGDGLEHKQHIVKETKLTADEALALADVVITGVPSPKYKVNVDLLKPGVVAINFSSAKNFDAPAIKARASLYVPSVGKVTVAMLQRNLLRLYQYQLDDAKAAASS
ncbi:Methylenetetrahydrofolate dehydrogenase [NAD(+)] [Blastocladiella emersonii ATCC 22665]|nr:Methylenetetrahydrofolate dehydrogenase [NAD(+)] [Blastocladiella emersonii ATCC 22665]